MRGSKGREGSKGRVRMLQTVQAGEDGERARLEYKGTASILKVLSTESAVSSCAAYLYKLNSLSL